MRRMVLPGYITEEQAEVHPNKNFLSLPGDEAMPEIDFGGADQLQDGDAFLLCSDGLWAYFKNDELGAVLDQEPPRKAAEMLIDRARQRARGRRGQPFPGHHPRARGRGPQAGHARSPPHFTGRLIHTAARRRPYVYRRVRAPFMALAIGR